MAYTITEALSDAKKALKKGKYLIVLVFIVFAAGGWYNTSLMPVSYTAKSLFYPDKDATTTGSPLDLIVGGVTTKSGALGILAKVLNSRSMTKMVVSHKVDSTANSKILADYIIQDFNKNYKPWQKQEDIKNMNKNTKIERAAAIIRSGSFAVLDESGFMSLSTKAFDKTLALRINKIIIQELIKFNFDKKTEKALVDLRFINTRTDSVSRVYEVLKYKTANYIDENKYLIKATVKIPQEDLEEKKKIISSRYLKLVELQEQAFIRLQTDKPVIQLLDQPYIESYTNPSKEGSAIVYGIIGMLFSFLFVVRKSIINLVSSELSKSMKGLTKTESVEGEEEASETE
jgi:uncharacterized protein involved in exopolysaccharide biosynthesis